MKIKKGIGVSPGVAIAPGVVLDAEEFDIPQRYVPVDHAQAELARLRKAANVSRREIQDLQKRTAKRIGKEIASIFDFHLGLLNDKVLQKKFAETILGGHVTAEYAVATVLRGYAKEFLAMPQYLAERVKDVYDIEKRLLRNLIGQQRQSLSHLRHDVIVLAHDLTPSQTAGMDREHMSGLAIDAGGQTSHTAIVARALGIPAVVGLNNVTAEATGGDTIIIDGNRGVVVINPDERTVEEYRQYARQQVEFVHSLDALRDLPAITRDGHDVTLLGNIEFPYEVATVLAKGGVGIGLYRTEFLYLGSDTEPTEEDHFRAYRQVTAELAGRPIAIRTVDLGADKYTQSRSRVPERNPFLGCRSIRYCLQNLGVFKTQIRAILRASVDAEVSMLFPLISNLLELRQAKTVVRDVMEDLEEEGIEYRTDIPIGMMVETPSAALQCDSFAQEVDFFSLGTNDLVQYTLAVDRGNERVASLFSVAHPSVLRLIKEVIRAGQRHGVPVSLCGEMAGEPQYTLLLLGLGLRSFSAAPPAIPEIKKVIRSVTLEQAMEVARRVMSFDSDKEIINYLRAETRKLLPEAYV
ncbi:MAG: phosphoenolpyruvate--protein phosphotransferase, partial [Phycisphaerae bacterium]|nr:phosphoenolpyruvate--protein phosphotransferase [Phycisphaerae bacterium]